MSKKDSRPSEYKTFPYIELKREDDQGIVEHLITVFGIMDHGKDVSHPGAFAKTIAERGGKIRVLDAHNTGSLLNVVGKPLSLREVGKDELPPTVLEEYPEATGGLWARTQFLMDTPEGKGVFTRIKEGAINEFSFGYDALDYDYDTIKADGEDVEVRNLRTMRLWEYSPVMWGMNPATTMMSAKEDATTDAIVESNTTSDVAVDLPPEEDKGEAEPDEMKPEVTENYVRIPVDKGDHEGHRIRTIAISAEKGIKALYCGECKAVITYLFDKDKWSADDAKEWIKEHKSDESVTDRVRLVEGAFRDEYVHYEGKPTGPYFYVSEVYEDYVIICGEGDDYYKVSYTRDGDEITFAPREEWIEGSMEFIAKAITKEIDVGALLEDAQKALAEMELFA